jgi:hypothetical protein
MARRLGLQQLGVAGKVHAGQRSASLCKGAVTSAATSPRSAARAAHCTLRAAASPAALTCPQGAAAGISGSCSTGIQRGGTSHAWAGAPMAATGK